MLSSLQGICVKQIGLESTDWSEHPNPPEVEDKANLLPKKIEILGLGVYVEDLNLNISRSTNLLLPYAPPSAVDGEEAEGEDIGRNMSGRFIEDMPSGQAEDSAAAEGHEETAPSWFQRWFCGKKADHVEEPELEEEEEEKDGTRATRGSRRFKRGWQTDANDSADIGKIYSFDGRVSWRRLIAPFSRKRLYDLAAQQWVDDPNDSDIGIKLPNRYWNCTRGSRGADEQHMHINFYENTDIDGYVGREDDDRIIPDSADEILAGDDESPVLVRVAPDGSRPSLRLKLEQLDDFLKIAAMLNEAYHPYLIEPRAVELLLTLAVLPILPTEPTRRCWSQWGESKRSIEVVSRGGRCTFKNSVVSAGAHTASSSSPNRYPTRWASYQNGRFSSTPHIEVDGILDSTSWSVCSAQTELEHSIIYANTVYTDIRIDYTEL